MGKVWGTRKSPSTSTVGIRILCFFVLFFQTADADDKSVKRDPLYRQLTGRSEQIRQRAITRLERDPQSQRSALDSVIAAARDQAVETSADEIARPSSVRLLYLIGSVEDDACEELLIDLLDDDHFGIAMVAADALGANKRYTAIEYLKKQVDRPEFQGNYGFRFNLVRSIAQMEHPDAVEFLTQLEPRLEGQLHFEVEKLLNEVTADHFLGDEARYEKWLAAKKPKIIFRKASFESTSAPRMNFGKPQRYYDIDINAKRMMFIIDRSGSMKDYVGGMTRLERAKVELVRAIQALPADSEFAITFYDTAVRQWRDQLVIASEPNKLEAIAFVNRLGYGDRTNTYGALREALEFDEQLEVVFLLSDGQPNLGEIVRPDLIVADIMHRNRFRHLNFNTIGIAVNDHTERFLRTLAERSSGEYRRAN